MDKTTTHPHLVDRTYCNSSYLAFRYIEAPYVDYRRDMHHECFQPVSEDALVYVTTAHEIDAAIQKQFDALRSKRLGILLSGGMDSAILASYMRGADAYTFRFLGGKFGKEELSRAEYYAKYYGLTLHYVDIDWSVVEKHIDALMDAKGAAVHSIEPQILAGALQAKADGIELMIVGESSDLIFGGMDQLLSKDWTVEEFTARYTFLEPSLVLKEAADTTYLFERYRKGNHIDLLPFMDNVFSIESSSSYMNAFNLAGMPYYDPYARLRMSIPLNLSRVRNGEPKYLIRELFSIKYPEMPVPDKIPMPRPVDAYFKDYAGPTSTDFKENIDMTKLTGNQKWQLWCLDRFLHNLDK